MERKGKEMKGREGKNKGASIRFHVAASNKKFSQTCLNPMKLLSLEVEQKVGLQD